MDVMKVMFSAKSRFATEGSIAKRKDFDDFFRTHGTQR